MTIARAVVRETRQVVCATCGEGPVSGGPGYLVKLGREGGDVYVHGNLRTCSYVIRKRIEDRKTKPAWVRLWLAVRDVFGR